MKFVFWQNIISIHQSAFLKELTKEHDVTLVVEYDLENERKKQGWNIPYTENIKIIVSPDKEIIYKLLDNKSIHVFSGINAFPTVYFAFKHAVKNRLNIGLMLEPFEWQGLIGKLKWLKYRTLSYFYESKIDFILAIGQKAVTQYKSVGFKEEIIFEWGYFVEQYATISFLNAKTIIPGTRPLVLFVGRIDKNKNIQFFVNLIKKNKNLIERLTIIGDGPDKNELLSNIKELSFIDYKGILPNRKVQKLISENDLLVLPSKYDGWGAVVNEALHVGTPVIASENCGASVLLDGNIRGEKFFFKGKNDLETVLLKWLGKGKVKPEQRAVICKWSNDNISGRAASDYLLKIINFISKDKQPRPVAPWIDK